MGGAWRALVCGLLGAGVAQAGARAPGGPAPVSTAPHFWVARAGSRIPLRGPPAHPAELARVTAVAGERESFVVVMPVPPGATTWMAGAAPPVSERGVEASFKLYRLEFVEVGGELLADMLIPIELGVPVPVSPGAENLALWVDVALPRGARTGTWAGGVEIHAGAVASRVPVVLTVLPGRIPSEASLPTAFEFSLDDAAVANGIGREGDPAGRLAQAYSLAALEDRVSLTGGQRAPPYRVSPGDGTMVLDFADFDRDAEPLMEGVAELGGATATTLGAPQVPGLSAMDRFKYLLAFRSHLKDRGWDDRLVDFTASAGLGGPGTPRTGSAPQLGSWSECLASEASLRPWWSADRDAAMGQALALGGPELAPRGLGWLAYASRTSGVRYDRALDGFSRVPWKGRSGAMALFYPGYVKDEGTGGYRVVESVRMKLLRDGLEDYELLVQARSAGHAAAASRWVKQLAPAPGKVSTSPELFDAAKRALVELGQPDRLPARRE